MSAVRLRVGLNLLWLALPLPLALGAQCADPQAYEVQTVAYPHDAPANAVLDKRSGLQWRRCEEGQRWDGAACQGQARSYTHEQALRHGASLRLWRLPDVRQLGSLPLRSCRFPALDATAFVTGELSAAYWSSTPFAGSPASAWQLDVGTGGVGHAQRQMAAGLRLVRR